MGILAAVLANVHRGRRAKAFTPGDFMPKFDDRRKPTQQSPAAIRQVFRLITNAVNTPDAPTSSTALH